MWHFPATRPLSATPRWEFVVHTNSTQVLHMNSTKVLSLFYHRSGIIFVELVAKPRVATQYHFNEKPHTITDDMVSHHVITLFFVLLATRSIQKNSTFGGMVYITTEVAKTVVSLLRGFTTLPPCTHLTLENQRVSFIFFSRSTTY